MRLGADTRPLLLAAPAVEATLNVGSEEVLETVVRQVERDLTACRAELDGHVHRLRYTYCPHLVQAGVLLRTAQVLAGHASARSTERCAQVAPSTLRDAIAGLAL